MLVEITGGLDVRLTGTPEQAIDDARDVQRVALVGLDYPGLRPVLEVEIGERVALGQGIACDRAHPQVRYAAPGSGRVAEINRGSRRGLVSIVIELDGSDRVAPAAVPAGSVSVLSGEQVREVLLGSGWWPALRKRPYGKVASPDGMPEALFVTAMDTNPLAADPQIVVGARADDFVAGLQVLSKLAPHTFLCCARGAELPDPGSVRVATVQFAGRHPAGLVGTHIQYLHPEPREVWHVGYQDVLAIGRLFATGSHCFERVVAIAGPAAQRPRLLRTRLGADLLDLVSGEVEDESRIISGSVLTGRAVTPASGFLGRYHNQLSVLPAGTSRADGGWLRRLAGQLRRPGLACDGAQPAGWTSGMLAVEAFDRVWPFPSPPGPLLRALLAGDTETAQRLGCEAFAEEDMALCSYVCPAQLDYGSALRATLNEIERGR